MTPYRVTTTIGPTPPGNRPLVEVLREVFGDFMPDPVYIVMGGEFAEHLRRRGWDGRLPDA